MRLKRLFILILVLVSFIILSIYYDFISEKFNFIRNNKEFKNNYEFENVSVLKIIDGDTIKTNNGTIRLLGVNTPEKGKKYYNKAKEYLKEIENKNIKLLRDSKNFDKYNRKLRYIFYDNRIMNVEILEKGLGTSFMIKGLRYEEKLKNAENFAKQNEINLWEKSKNVCVNCIKLIDLNAYQEFFILKNNCEFNCDLNNWFVKDNANHFFKLNKLDSHKSIKIKSKQKIWNNDKDRFFMYDNNGKLVIFYEYFNKK